MVPHQKAVMNFGGIRLIFILGVPLEKKSALKNFDILPRVKFANSIFQPSMSNAPLPSFIPQPSSFPQWVLITVPSNLRNKNGNVK